MITRVLNCRAAGDLFIRQRSFRQSNLRREKSSLPFKLRLNKTYAWLAVRIVSIIAACLVPTGWAQSANPRLISVIPGNGRVVVNWQGGTALYQLQCRTNLTAAWEDVGAPTSDTSFTLVQSESTMFYRIKGSITKAENKAPSTPSSLAATAVSCSQINLSWAASTDPNPNPSGVKGYNVFRGGIFLKQVLAPTTYTTDTGLAGSTTYTYTVAAIDNAGNQSTVSTAASATTSACLDGTAPTVPTGLAVTPVSCSQINLAWNPSSDTGGSGLWGYNIYRNGGFLKQVLAPATSTTDSGLLASTSYSYTVLAFDNALNVSAQSAPVSRTTPSCSGADTTPPSVPTGLSASAVSCSQINLTWNASTDTGSGVRAYNVYRNGAFLRQVTANLTSDSGLNASTSYSYTVLAIDNASNQSAQSASSSATTPPCADTVPPSVPTGLSVNAASCNQIDISWSASSDSGGSGLRGYNVYRNGVFLRQVLAPATSTSDSGLAASTSYSYAVSAIDNANNQSAQTGALSRTTPACPDTVPPSVPTSLSVNAASCSQIDISWSASSDSGGSGLRGYNIYRNGVFLRQVLAPATSTSDSGLAASTGYSYAVSAIDNANNQSAQTAAITRTTPACADTTAPSVPTGLSVNAASCNQIDISWSASSDSGGSGLRGYNVYRNGVFLRQVLAPATSTSDSGLAASTSYSYAVSAIDNANNQSAQTAAISRTTPSCPDTVPPSVPTGLSASAASCSQINISWNASTDTGGSGLRGYNVYRNGAFLRQVLAPATSTSDSGLNASTSYSYVAVAIDNANNVSAQSASSSATTPSCPDTFPPSVPTGLSASAANCSQINISWNASTDTGGSGLKGYNLYRNGVFLRQVLAPATSTSDSGLNASSSYSYTAVAVDNASNASGQSTASSATTPACPDSTAPSIPSGLNVRAVDCSQIEISWNASTDTGGSGLRAYNVYRNGVFLRQVLAPSTSAYDSGLTGSTTYSYTVSAIDNANNQSGQATAVSATTPPCPCNYVIAPTSASANASGGVGSVNITAGSGCSWSASSSTSWISITSGSAGSGNGTVTYSVAANGGTSSRNGTLTIAGHTFSVTQSGSVDSGPVLSAGRYGGTGYDDGRVIALAPGGNIVCAGLFQGAVSIGGPNLASAGGNDIFIAKHSAAGDHLWSRRCGGTSNEVVKAIAADRNGDIFVTGNFEGTADFGGGPLTSAGGNDIFLAKYSGADGRHLWSKRFGSPSPDQGVGLAVDSVGNVIITGIFSGVTDFGGGLLSVSGNTIYAAKYNSLGVHLWSKAFGSFGSCVAGGVAVDSNDNILLTGSFLAYIDFGGGPVNALSEFSAIYLAKLTSGGAHVWSKSIGNSYSANAYALTVDSANNVLLTGQVRGTVDFGGGPVGSGYFHAFIAKYSPNGGYVWAKGIGYSGGGTSTGYAIMTDAADNVVVSGAFTFSVEFGGGVVTSAGGNDIFVGKYSGSNGSYSSLNHFGGPSSDFAFGLAASPRGGTLVIGGFAVSVDFGGFQLTSAGSGDAVVLELKP